MVELISFGVAFVAGISALIGIIILSTFFHDKFKQLFDDTNYFIFFFLVMGYILYALGELSYVMSNLISTEGALTGIQDIYWFSGGLFILISFMSFSLIQARKNNQFSKFGINLMIGIVLSIVAFVIVIRSNAPFFNYVYPILSALIVGFSSSSFLFSGQLGEIANSLKFFFLASASIYVGDILFALISTQTTALIVVLSDVFYLVGYTLSGVAFVMFTLKVRSQLFVQEK